MNPETNNMQLKEYAQLLYTRHDTSIADIATATQLNEATVRYWIQQDGWDGIKRTLLTAKAHQLEQLYALLEKVTTKMRTEDNINAKDADLAVKYTAAIKNLDTEVGIPQIIEVAKLFTTWLRRRNGELAKSIIVEFDIFIKQRLKANV
jgi:hypothetical protein